MTTHETDISQKHVPPFVGVGLAIAVTGMLWSNGTLHWITPETTLLAGGVTCVALWALIIVYATNRARVQHLLDGMTALRTPRTVATPAPRPNRRTRRRIRLGYFPALSAFVLGVVATVTYWLDPAALDWITAVPRSDIALAGVADALVWIVAVAAFTRARSARRLSVAYHALLQGEELAQHVMQSVPVMVSVSLPDGTRRQFNKRYVDVTGRSEEQLIGRGWLECVHEDDRTQFTKMFSKMPAKPFEVEYGLTGADGENRWIRELFVPRMTDGGQVEKYVVTGLDITSQVETDTQHDRTIGRLQAELAEAKSDWRKESTELRNRHAKETADFKTRAEQEAELLRASLSDAVASLKGSSREEVEALTARHAEEIDRIKTRLREETRALKATHRDETKSLKKQLATFGESRNEFEQRFQEAQQSAQKAGEQLTVLRTEISQGQADLKAASVEQQETKVENRKLRESLEKLESVMQKMEADDDERRGDLERQDKRIECAKEEAAERRQNESKLRAKVSRLTTRVQTLEEELSGARDAQGEAVEQAEKWRQETQAGQGEMRRELADTLRPQLSGLIQVAERLNDAALDESQLVAIESARAAAKVMTRLVDGALGETPEGEARKAVQETDQTIRPFDMRAAVRSVCDLVAPTMAGTSIEIRNVCHPDFPARVNGDPVRLREVMIDLLHRVTDLVEDGTISVTLSDTGTTMAHIAARFEVRHDTARYRREELEELLAMRTPPTELECGDASATRYSCAVAWQLVSGMDGTFGLDTPDVPGQDGFGVWFEVTLPKQEAPVDDALPSAAPVAGAVPASAPTASATITASAPGIATAATLEPGSAAPRMPQEDLVSNLGEVLELGADSAKIRCAREPDGAVTVEIRQDDEPLSLLAEIVSSERAPTKGHDVVFRFVDIMPQARQQLFQIAMTHRKN